MSRCESTMLFKPERSTKGYLKRSNFSGHAVYVYIRIIILLSYFFAQTTQDIIANDEICCWMFYGNGKKVTEVCCTSIVYATDRKHTKVEFPEARIFEDTLNILLYEVSSIFSLLVSSFSPIRFGETLISIWLNCYWADPIRGNSNQHLVELLDN